MPEQGERVAIVTGGAGGLGQAMTRALVADGVRVAVMGRNAAKARRFAGEMGESVLAVTGDISREADGVTGWRFIAARWDADLSPAEAAKAARSPIGWPELAAATVVWPDD